jgi:predicted transglutaminase-like cysteine proteinase
VALAFLGRRPACKSGLLGFAAAALIAAGPARAQSADAAPSAGPAPSRWALPPANVAMRSAILGGSSRMEQILLAQRSIAPRTLPTASNMFVGRAEPVADTPNVFGSVALAVAQTPLDPQWQRANAVVALDQWTTELAAFRSGGRDFLLRQVNAWVNDHVEFADDASLHGLPDRWSGAAETLRRGRGDCEDYALTKMQLLAALGFARDDMYLVVVRDTLRQGDHAVLVVRTGGRFLVLDNLTDVLVESDDRPDYRPMISYSAAGRWVHGFPVEAERIRVATGFPRTAP